MGTTHCYQPLVGQEETQQLKLSLDKLIIDLFCKKNKMIQHLVKKKDSAFRWDLLLKWDKGVKSVKNPSTISHMLKNNHVTVQYQFIY